MSDYNIYFGISSIASFPIKRNYDDVVFIKILTENLDYISNELKIGQVKFISMKEIHINQGKQYEISLWQNYPNFWRISLQDFRMH